MLEIHNDIMPMFLTFFFYDDANKNDNVYQIKPHFFDDCTYSPVVIN